MKNLKFTSLLAMSLVLVLFSFMPDKGVYEIGDKVEDFKLKGVDDQWVSLSEYMGEEGVILVFTCNTCPYAQLYEDRLIELHNTFSSQGFPVLAVNPNDPNMKPGDSFDAMKDRNAEKNFPYPYLMDTEQKVFPQYGATRTPEIFLLDKNMTLQYTGAIDDNPQDPSSVGTEYVADAINAIKAGKTPDPTKTKAIGCGIKVKKEQG